MLSGVCSERVKAEGLCSKAVLQTVECTTPERFRSARLG